MQRKSLCADAARLNRPPRSRVRVPLEVMTTELHTRTHTQSLLCSDCAVARPYNLRLTSRRQIRICSPGEGQRDESDESEDVCVLGVGRRAFKAD